MSEQLKGKTKLLLTLEFVAGEKAAELLGGLIGGEVTLFDFAGLVEAHKVPMYEQHWHKCDPSAFEYRQRLNGFPICLRDDEWGFQLYTCPEFDWHNDNEDEFTTSYIAVFKTKDIQALAEKINGFEFSSNQAEVDNLNERITELEEQNANLENENSKLKQSGKTANGLLFPYSTPELEVMRDIAFEYWHAFNPQNGQPHQQKIIQAAIAEKLGETTSASGDYPYKIKSLATAIRHPDYPTK